MIQVMLDEILNNRGQSLYWLQQHTGIAYTTLWRLRTGKANSITFPILNVICDALECRPGDLLIKVDDAKQSRGKIPAANKLRLAKKGK